MKPHQDCQITEPPPLRMEDVIVHTSYFRPHIMTTDDLGLAGWRKSQFTEGPNPSGYYTAGIDIPRLDTFGKPDWHYCAIEFHSKEKSEAEARRDIVISALRSPRAVPANGAGHEALERAKIDLEAALVLIELHAGQSALGLRQTIKIVEAALASSPVVGPSTQPRPHRVGGQS